MTPHTKITYNGQSIKRTRKGTYAHKTLAKRITASIKRTLARLWYYTKLLTILATAAVAFYVAGAVTASTHIIEAQTITLPPTIPPIMQRIIKCESHNHQFAPSGQVLMRANTNKTVDVGIAQINTIWFAQATKLGYDLTTEKGNTDMALWIYANKGTAPWYSSSNCWNK